MKTIVFYSMGVCSAYAHLNLPNGNKAIVDANRFESMNEFCWHQSPTGYVTRSGNTPGTRYLHRVILGALQGQEVDHINGDKLDNRSTNLRFATRSQNLANTRILRRNTSGFKGVNRRKDVSVKPWRAYITHGGTFYALGCFETAEEAARAYDTRAREVFGEFALLNFGEEEK